MSSFWDSQHPDYYSPARASLAQAFCCFAYGLRPLAPKIEEQYDYPDLPKYIYDREQNLETPINEFLAMREASDELLAFLASGKLDAKGCELILHDTQDYQTVPSVRELYFHGRFSDHCEMGGDKIIAPEFWKACSPDWSASLLNWGKNHSVKTATSRNRLNEIVGYVQVSIATEDLKSVFEQSVSAQKVPASGQFTEPSPGNRSPYLKFLIWAEAELGARLEKDNAEQITEWLEAEGKNHVSGGISKNMAKTMTTIMRTPAQGHGGNKKT